VRSAFLLNVVLAGDAAVLQLPSIKNQTLLTRGDTFCVLDLGLNIVNGVRKKQISKEMVFLIKVFRKKIIFPGFSLGGSK